MGGVNKLGPRTPIRGPRHARDGRGRVTSGPLLDASLGPTLVFTVCPPPEVVAAWQLSGAEVITTPNAASRVAAVVGLVGGPQGRTAIPPG